MDLSLHWEVLLLTVGVTLTAALLFGVAPALRTRRLSPQDAIRLWRGVTADASGVLGGALVVAQVALSFVLVFTAGLFARTFASLAHRDLGLQSEGVLLVNLDAQRSSAPPGQRVALFARAEEAVKAVPGVARAALSSVNPVSGMSWTQAFEVQGSVPPVGRERISLVNAVTPGWFRTYGTALLAGRDFQAFDGGGTPPVAIVNQAFARRFLGGRNPVGHLLRDEHSAQEERPPPLEIVGLARDAVYHSPREDIEPTVYLPVAQQENMWAFATLGVRAGAGSPALLTRKIAAAIGTVDPGVSLTFRLFSEQVGAAVMRERIVAELSGFFGALALLLAGIGLYGVTAYAVSRRRGEIGVRMALGAQASAVVRLVLGRSLRLVALGLAIGVAASLWASRLVASLLYGLEPDDVPTLVAAAATLAAITLLAAGLPARRAARIDPAEVLREG